MQNPQSLIHATIACIALMATSLGWGESAAVKKQSEGGAGKAPASGEITQLGAPVSLAGEWKFRIDEKKAGAKEKWFGGNLAGDQLIKLPGTMDEAGLGPKNTNAPTLYGPYRIYNYTGQAWYQREIEIPASWQGQRVALSLEHNRWFTSVWLDDRFIGSQDSLIAPHQYDFGTGVTPGKHRLTIRVDNTEKINLGGINSALKGGTWNTLNGIVGRIELAATPPVWIEEVQVYPNVEKMTARVAVKIGNATGKAGKGTMRVSGPSCPASIEADVTWDEKGGKADVTVDMKNAKLWDEFAPNLQTLEVRLTEPSLKQVDTKTVRFGMRSFASKGTQFTMNGRPLFLRGTLDCMGFPLTGYPPTDTASWLRICKIIKSHGLNYVRFHSWCPPEAAFTAADETGLMLQVEGPVADVPAAGADKVRDVFIEAEFKRIVDTYGNHPSFCTMALGNELFAGNMEIATRWIGMLIERDPRHLYTGGTGDCGQKTPNCQWKELSKGRGFKGATGSSKEAVAGVSTEGDIRKTVADNQQPILGHEIGEWMYYPDFKEIGKWTGVFALRNFELIRDDLAKKHQLELAPEYVQVSGKFATLLYKDEIEVLLRTPGYAGFSLLDLHDYPTQGTAVVGPLDAFWDSKGFVTPESFRRYCGPTVPLLRMPKRTYLSDEPFSATADLANYGPKDLEQAQPVWKITDAQGAEIAAGTFPALNAQTGKLTPLGTIKASFAKVTAPCKLKVTVALKGTDFANDWDIWVYPAAAAPQPPKDVVVCEKWQQAKAALEEGKKVVYFALEQKKTPTSMRGTFLPVFWSPVTFNDQKPNTMGLLLDSKHPLFAQFPTESWSNWQWYELMQRSRLFILDDAAAEYRPLAQVIDNFARNHRLGLIFEGRVGKGSLLVCGLDLPNQTKDPAARQLLASIYAYVGSPAFNPPQVLSEELLGKIFEPENPNKLGRLGAKIRADSTLGIYSAERAIDGDPTTLWHAATDANKPRFPHELVVDLPHSVKLEGITCLPRQDGQRGGEGSSTYSCIKDYAVYVSDDGKKWGQPVANGSFPPEAVLHAVKFDKPVETKHLKLVAVSGFDPSKPFVSLAELDIIEGK